MIQFNLLPDVKLAYIRAMRLKRAVAVFSSLAAVVTLAIMLILLATVDVLQKHEITNNNNQITADINSIQSIPSLNQILTVQNQITALPKLYNQDPVADRMFNYISEITPANATISALTINFAGATTTTSSTIASAASNTISIQGNADSIDTVNKFVDTMKFSTYGTATSGTSSSQSPFTNVLLSSFSFTSESGASYNITASFNPAIFDRSSNATLTVPNLITTRSELDQPKVLFQTQPTTTDTTKANTNS